MDLFECVGSLLDTSLELLGVEGINLFPMKLRV